MWDARASQSTVWDARALRCGMLVLRVRASLLDVRALQSTGISPDDVVLNGTS